MGEERTFNLLDEQWIPIAGVGERSLLEVFQDKSLRRLGGTPAEKNVLLRFLLCIVHASSPVEDQYDWDALTTDIISQNALEYLEKWRDRFDLYDEKYPFLQFPQMKGTFKKANLGVLAWNVSTGNKTILTQWNQPQVFSPAEIARLLLCGAGYGAGGKKYDNGHRIHPAGTPKGKSGKLGTLTGFSGYLHTFLLGETLLETLRRNLLTTDFLRECEIFDPQNPLGRPFWEKMPEGEDDSTARAYRKTYMGILFPMDKFFCLEGDSLLLTDAVIYPTHKQGQWDPGITLIHDANGKLEKTRAIWCDSEKKPWRQLTALLAYLVEKGQKTPVFLRYGSSCLEDHEDVYIWAGGVSVSNNSGEQYVSGRNDYVESEVMIPAKWMTDAGQSFLRYRDFMSTLEEFSRILYSSVRGYHKALKEDNGDDFGKRATQLFWEKLEPMAQEIIYLSKADDSEVERAKKQWRRIGAECYAQSCPYQTARQLAAYAENLPKFETKEEAAQRKKDKGKRSQEVKQ